MSDLRLWRERPRDRDALALAARELARQRSRLVLAETDRVEQLAGAALALGSASRSKWTAAPRRACAARDLARIERRVGILEHDLDQSTPRSRRSARRRAWRRARLRPARSRPDVGVSRPTSIRAIVVLPEPDSPTMPSDPPALDRERHVRTACTSRAARETARRTSERLVRFDGSSSGRRSGTLGTGSGLRSSRISSLRRRPMNASGRSRRSGGRLARQRPRHEGAAGMERAARRGFDGCGGLPGNDGEPVVARLDRRPRLEQARRVRVEGLGEELCRRLLLHRHGPRT